MAATGAVVAATGAAVASSGGRPSAVKKKGGGLGQMVGVVLGGLMALPITYAILIWGFQKDPFKLGKQVPPQLAFLLPQKLQPGYRPPRKADAGPSLDAAPSLDDLPSMDETSVPPASEPADTVAAASTETETMATDTVAASSVEPAAASAEPTEPAEPGSDTANEAVASDDTIVAPLAMAAAASPATLPPTDPLSGLDALVADVAVAVTPAPAAEVASLPPLDVTAVEMAAERATQAFETLKRETLEHEAQGTITDATDPARDRLLVVWYKRLAQLSEELVRLETMASDSGRSFAATPAAAADLFDRICVSERAVADLDRLGRMWLTTEKRRADGVAVVVTLGASRQIGPSWSTRAVVSGELPDGTDRSLSIISRMAPPADAGDRVVVAGVLFDGDAIWAADMRPVAPEPTSGSEPE